MISLMCLSDTIIVRVASRMPQNEEISKRKSYFTDLFCRLGDKRMTVLQAEVGSGLSRQKAELGVLRLTSRVRDAS